MPPVLAIPLADPRSSSVPLPSSQKSKLFPPPLTWYLLQPARFKVCEAEPGQSPALLQSWICRSAMKSQGTKTIECHVAATNKNSPGCVRQGFLLEAVFPSSCTRTGIHKTKCHNQQNMCLQSLLLMDVTRRTKAKSTQCEQEHLSVPRCEDALRCRFKTAVLAVRVKFNWSPRA